MKCNTHRKRALDVNFSRKVMNSLLRRGLETRLRIQNCFVQGTVFISEDSVILPIGLMTLMFDAIPSL